VVLVHSCTMWYFQYCMRWRWVLYKQGIEVQIKTFIILSKMYSLYECCPSCSFPVFYQKQKLDTKLYLSLLGKSKYLEIRKKFQGVGIAQWYSAVLRAGWSRVRVPVRTGNFSLHHRVQTGSGAHPACYPMGTRGSFPGGKAARAWSWPLTST
jgi:hypothetical protein